MVNYFRQASFRLFSGQCLLCGRSSHAQSEICNQCKRSLPWQDRSCLTCAIPFEQNTENRTFCGNCLKQPPPFESCFAPWTYHPPIAQLIQTFKYSGDLASGQLLAELFTEWLRPQLGSRKPDLILAVPMHWRRIVIRSHNHAQFLADNFAAEMGCKSPSRLLIRRRSTPQQSGLDASDRRRNLRGAFRIRHSVEGLHIALVDDVFTTGATATELSRELLRAGAESVSVWCLARTP